MRMAVAVSACLLLAGCQTQSKEPEIYTPKKLTSAQGAAVHDGVRNALKDPESARFGSVVAGVNSDDVLVACGWVNARNSFGGYTGEKPFMGVLTKQGGFVPVSIGGDRTEVQVTMNMCARSGLAL